VVGSVPGVTGFGPGSFLAAYGADGYLTMHTDRTADTELKFRAVVATDDNTFVAAGFEQPSGATRDAILARVTLDGTLTVRWTRRLGGPGNEDAYAVTALSGGDFLVVGATDPQLTGVNDLYVVRTDGDGVPRWSRSFGAPDDDEVGLCVCATPDGAFVAAGYVATPRNARDVYLVKFDGNGNLIWQNTLGGSADDLALAIIPADGGFLVTGSSDPGPHGQRDILVMRLGPDGRYLTN
jgi:outer membrane protein assembly factor BamB